MAGLVIGLGDEPGEDEGGEVDLAEAQESAARDMMDAIKADNASKLAAALQDFLLLGPSTED